MSDTEWGPWVTYGGDLSTVPRGMFVEAEAECVTGLIKLASGMAGGSVNSAWDWSAFGRRSVWRVLRYRVRKPRALRQLQEMIREISPEKENAV